VPAPSSERPDIDRLAAADLQERANALVSDPSIHRVIRATDHGWVEIQGEFLDELVALAQDNADLPALLRERAGREPLNVDISDYSDEWCAGFLAGQVNALDALAGDGGGA
jgi:hypothetical protein